MAVEICLFNTLSRKKEVFKPQKNRTVRLYTCGPTVYRVLHIGNYRTYIFEDILKRTLLTQKYKVEHIMNITDVGHLVGDGDTGEDKLEKEAAREHKSALDIARTIEDIFKQDLKALDILPPTKYTRATEYIPEQIALIEKLEKKGFTYKTSDGIYFDTLKFPNYGALAPHAKGAIKAGARVDIGEKRAPTDFALWKFSPSSGPHRQLEWASPWGTGFPGWHIECSAMALKYLGPTLDIHAGGIDHAEIHHPNEIAQSEAATGKQFSRVWMHGAFLTIKGDKMAKSSPETNITIEVIKKRGFDPLDFRYLTLGTHYRKPLSFSWKGLASTRTSRLNLARAYNEAPKTSKNTILKNEFQEKFLAAINDDLNTPKALAALQSTVKKGAGQDLFLWADHILGLDMKKQAALLQKEEMIPKEILELADMREEYRSAKEWQKADEIRKKIENLGWEIKDTPGGSEMHKI